MKLIFLILVVVLLFGGGWYGYGAYGPPYGYWPGGLGLLLLIIVIVMALGGRL